MFSFRKQAIGETKLGKNGEIVSEKVQKTAVFGLKSGKNGTFLK